LKEKDVDGDLKLYKKDKVVPKECKDKAYVYIQYPCLIQTERQAAR